MARCPNGHESTWDDYCSSCGAAMGGSAAPPAASAAASAAPDETPAPDPAAPDVGSGACPNCGETRHVTDVFCEGCGYDFASGTLPAAPAAPLTGSTPATPLRLAISADRAFFDAQDAGDTVDYPSAEPAPITVELTGSKVLIGRVSHSRGIHPEIDVTALTGDPAVSSRHAMLERRADGSWTLTDLGSTNGTHLGGAAIAPHTPLPVAGGAVVHVGAWTRLEVVA